MQIFSNPTRPVALVVLLFAMSQQAWASGVVQLVPQQKQAAHRAEHGAANEVENTSAIVAAQLQHGYGRFLDARAPEHSRRNLNRYLGENSRGDEGSRATSQSTETGPSSEISARNDGLSFDSVAPIPGLTETQDYVGHSLTQLPNGDVAVFYVVFGETTASLVFVSTGDAGATWSAPAAVREDVFAPVRAVVMNSGRVVVAMTGENRVETSYSDDNGATWTAGGAIANAFGVDMKLASNGDVLMSFGRFSTLLGVTEYMMARSSDGAVWSAPQLFITEVAGQGGFSIFDGTIVGLGDGAAAFVFVQSNSSGLHLAAVTSSDGSTWSAPFSILENGDALAPIPALAYAPDGTVWLVYADRQDLWYMTSLDDGATWSAPVKWTNYVGSDFHPAIAIVDGIPVVTFSSPRGRATSGIWIVTPSASADTNPDNLPPAISLADLSFQAQAGIPLDVYFAAVDESGLAGVEVTFTIAETTSDPVVAIDDGTGPDTQAGDGVWSATLPAMDIGTVFSYVGTATDTDGNRAPTFPFGLTAIGTHNVGNITMAMPGGYFQEIEWPAGSGNGFLFSGGLWVGATAVGQDERVTMERLWEPDESVAASLESEIADQDINVGIAEPSVLGTDALGVRVLQRSYQWSAESGKRAGEENGIVIAYDITNTGSVAAALTGVRVGLALDADLMTAGGAADDIVSYDGANNILYMYDSGVVCASEPTVDCTSGHLGVAVLSDAAAGKAAGTIAPATATCFAVGTVPECPAWAELISAYDLMSSGINTELAAGPVTARDYRMLIAAQPFELAALETKTVVFALAMGDGAAEMAANVAALSARYEAAIVGVEDELAVDESIEFTVSNSYPNPFAQATNLDVHLPEAGHLRVTVYDVIGRQVARLVDETVPSGQHTLTWDASNEPTGVYFFEVVTNSKQRTGQMVVAH